MGAMIDIHAASIGFDEARAAQLAQMMAGRRLGQPQSGGKLHAEVRVTHRRNGPRWSAHFDLRCSLAPKDVEEEFARRTAESSGQAGLVEPSHARRFRPTRSRARKREAADSGRGCRGERFATRQHPLQA